MQKDRYFEIEPPRDLLYGTTDRGDSWYLLPNQPRENLYTRDSPITFVSVPAEGQYLVGFTETYYVDTTINEIIGDVPFVFAYSNDTGATWSYHEFDRDSILFIRSPSMTFFDAERGVLTGFTRYGYSHGIVLRTYDGGRSWDVVMEGTHPSGMISMGVNHSRFISFDTGYGAVARRIARTYDGGRTWQRDSVPFIPVWGFQGARRTYIFNDSVGIAMSGTGALYYLDGATSSVRYMPPASGEAELRSAFIVRREDGAVVLPLPVEGNRHVRTLYVYDPQGKLMREEAITEMNSTAGGVTLDPSRMAAGVYMVSVIYSDGEAEWMKMLVR